VILEGKHILVFAATGGIASETARTFAREGAHVWLSARNVAALEEVAQSISAQGGTAHAHQVDATDSDAVDAYVKSVAAQAGRIDGVFNGIGGHVADLHYPEPSTVTPFSHFMVPLERILGSQFLTSRAVGAQLVEQGGGGAIVTLSATLSGMTAPYMAGISAACGAIEAMTRSLAGEFGPSGIRVNCVRGSGMPETRTIQETVAAQIAVTGQPPKMTLPPLGRPITVNETAKTAAFLMSELASGMTGQVVTVCAGAFVD
jgi:3-oxoacyl-[acyl-carrier protein] reductase